MRCRVSSSSSRLISVLFAREMSSQSSVPLDEAAFARVTAFLRSLLADEIRVDPKCFGRFSKERYFKNVELSQVRVVVRWFLLADPNSLRTWFGEVTHFSSDDAEDDQSLTVSYFCEAYVLDGKKCAANIDEHRKLPDRNTSFDGVHVSSSSLREEAFAVSCVIIFIEEREGSSQTMPSTGQKLSKDEEEATVSSPAWFFTMRSGFKPAFQMFSFDTALPNSAQASAATSAAQSALNSRSQSPTNEHSDPTLVTDAVCRQRSTDLKDALYQVAEDFVNHRESQREVNGEFDNRIRDASNGVLRLFEKLNEMQQLLEQQGRTIKLQEKQLKAVSKPVTTRLPAFPAARSDDGDSLRGAVAHNDQRYNVAASYPQDTHHGPISRNLDDVLVEAASGKDATVVKKLQGIRDLLQKKWHERNDFIQRTGNQATQEMIDNINDELQNAVSLFLAAARATSKSGYKNQPDEYFFNEIRRDFENLAAHRSSDDQEFQLMEERWRERAAEAIKAASAKNNLEAAKKSVNASASTSGAAKPGGKKSDGKRSGNGGGMEL